MSPDEIKSWVSIAQLLAGMGVSLAQNIKAMMASSHPALTPAQVEAAYTAILTDDAVRAAFAAQASQPSR